MVSDGIANAPVRAGSNPKDFAKKKRANRSAKLKQCKLDARREQWLSQVKNKRCNEEQVLVEKGRTQAMENLEIKPRGSEEIDGLMLHHYCESESPSSSPTSHSSSSLGGNDSGITFTGSSSSSSSSSSRSSSRAGGSCSWSMSEDDEGNDGCLDDWEAVADALAANDEKEGRHNPVSNLCPANNSTVAPLGHQSDSTSVQVSDIDIQRPKPDTGGLTEGAPLNFRAWRPDDAFRPQSLPNLSKQYSFPIKSERHYGHEGPAWGCRNVPVPTSCPICYEDLDLTDSSFLPCSCGFRLCLFCHKRILEEDGRCPGCRKQYKYEPIEGEATVEEGSLTFRLARSCSMISRS